MPPSTAVWPSLRNTVVLISLVSIDGTFTPPVVTTTVPTRSFLTLMSSCSRLSGVISGVTRSSSSAVLNGMVAAPLEAASWYGISVPCEITASCWLAAMMLRLRR